MTDRPLDPTPPSASSTSWGGRAFRRTAGGLAAAVTFALVAPALANAAGANVANPVVVALRGSADAVSGAFDDDGADRVCTPLASLAPVTAPADDTTDATPRKKAKKAKKAKKCAAASAAPSGAPSATASPSAGPASGEHGQIVSTVAGCAPRGKDPLFALTGAVNSHGAFVRAAAHGDTLALPFGSFDLATLSGAEQLCATLDAQRASLPRPSAKPGKDKAKVKPKPAKAHERKGNGHDGAEDQDN